MTISRRHALIAAAAGGLVACSAPALVDTVLRAAAPRRGGLTMLLVGTSSVDHPSYARRILAAGHDRGSRTLPGVIGSRRRRRLESVPVSPMLERSAAA